MAIRHFAYRSAMRFWDAYRANLSRVLGVQERRLDRHFQRLMQSARGDVSRALNLQRGRAEEQFENLWKVYRADMSRILGMRTKAPDVRFQTLHIGITDECNLTCRHCGRLPGQRKIAGTMPILNFARYLYCFAPHCFDELLVSGWGEPTVVSNLIDYLYLARGAGWTNVQFFTNGTCKDGALFEDIIAHDLLARLNISIEAANPELYESIRGRSFEGFQRFLNTVNRLRREHDSPLEIYFNVTCMRENLEDLPNIVRLAAKSNVQVVQMVHLYTEPNAVHAKGKLCVPEQLLSHVDRHKVVSVFAELLEIADRNGVRLVLPEPFPELTGACEPDPNRDPESGVICHEPFRWVRVHFNGDIYPCCVGNRPYALGNLDEEDFESIYTGAKYEKLRESLQPGGTPVRFCRGCGVIGDA